MAQQELEELLELSSGTQDILEEHDLHPLWEVEDDMGHVLDDLGSDVWKQGDVQAAINAVEEDVLIADLPPEFQRRIAVPINTANIVLSTICVGIQTVSPGETASSYRYRANAPRLAINGYGEMKTVVAGEEFPMGDNDLVTTPQWERHDHVNDGDETAMWPDALDLPLVLDSPNVENTFEYHELDHQPVTKTPGYWESQYGHTRDYGETKRDDTPGPFEGKCKATPPYRLGWDNTLEALRQRADNDTPDPHDGYSLLYVSPASRKPSLFPTMSFRVQLLQEETDLHFHNTTEVYFVIEGEGTIHVSDETLEWNQWNVFIATPDETHHRDPDGETILLGMTDRPMFEAFNLYVEAAPQ